MAGSQSSKPQVSHSTFVRVALTSLTAEYKRLERQIETRWDSDLSLNLDRILEAMRILENR